jgi:hypothetical protein
MKRILDYIETLQEKPEPTRKIIVAVSVAVITGIIIGIWMIIPATIPPISGTQSSASIATQTQSAGQPSPLTLLWNFIKDLASNI